MIEQTLVLGIAIILFARVIALVLSVSRALPGKPDDMDPSVYDEFVASRARHGLNS